MEFNYRKIKEKDTFNDMKNNKFRYRDSKIITKIDGEIQKN